MYQIRLRALSTLLLLVPLALASDHGVSSQTFVTGPWSLVQQGTTGVSGMQLVVVSETSAVIFDKVEHNPLMVDGHIAWSAELNINTQSVRALNPTSNTWCATGSFIGNGTLVSTAGNPIVITGASGLQAVRLFTPCSDQTCDILEDPTRIRLTSPRWYPSSARISDGSMIIIGGSMLGGYINNASVNNPTYEFFPPKNINGFNGLQIPMQFLHETLNANQFPIVKQLPDDTLFIAANQQAMIFDWKTNTEVLRLPDIPNGVRVTSPFSAGSVLLPLTPENNYTPEVMICGGSTISDTQDVNTVSAETPASAQCSRMVLTSEGIAAGWSIETMPVPRIMTDLILLPDGRIMIVNGAQTGVAGYAGPGSKVLNTVGSSFADNPAFTPVIYDPSAATGSRFSSDGIPASTIARMYHSTATLTPNGTIMLAGSNPNNDFTEMNSTFKYPTEYRLEFYSPPYMSQPRPSYSGLPAIVDYGSVFRLSITLPSNAKDVSVVLMDFGFATHGVHMDQRSVKLVSELSPSKETITVTGPPTSALYSPGPAFLFIVTDGGVPSFGHRTIIGTGASPPVNEGAIANMLNKTSDPSAELSPST
ncbi:hypothetical protein BT96DRAFT_918769 [Gymnopus androsaceus JB14]|uniref:Copper radical oxidase n=1 Tax=Gymnopus androsaceus JB14 TaxID=1447944 RepID=A0A6A4HQU8_9AGAR|nr:hypothetical protein BT96DRAFT_918769 [Gymnopus androsaceus JB14]